MGSGSEDTEKRRVCLIEPYFTGSHRAWAEGYAAHSRHDLRLLSLPGRWWKWRMRGGAVTLAERAAAIEGWRPDLLLVSGLVDVAALRAFLLPVWGPVPVVVYFHETQLTYPVSPRADPDVSYGFTNWTSALAAERVVFNSDYHRRVFLEALPRFLRSFPDLTHEHRVAEVETRSEVLPVGVELDWVGGEEQGADPPLVVWNHRWEHDKDPDAFAAAIDDVTAAGHDLRLALLGWQPPTSPPALERLRRRHADRICWDGEAPLPVYRSWLKRADVVVSTARQEFFGVAVVEAMAAGAFPVLPGRLSYPELLPADLHARCLYAGDPAPRLAEALGDRELRQEVSSRLRSEMQRFSWEEMAPRYDRLLGEIA